MKITIKKEEVTLVPEGVYDGYIIGRLSKHCAICIHGQASIHNHNITRATLSVNMLVALLEKCGGL